MKPFYLLPNRFKRIGFYLFPVGIIFWMATQLGWMGSGLSHSDRVAILSLSFFSFLFGLYFSIFSKERIEDECIQTIRLKSFQISAITQMLFFMIAFGAMFIFNSEPEGNGGLAAFFLAAIVLFWLSYLIAFNSTLIINKYKADD